MIYVFGDYELDTQLYELHRAGERLQIAPQVFNVLAYLVQHHDRTVTKEELLTTLWPGQFTNEAVLSYCIMTARKALGDSGRAQKIIKTLHGRGFRFIAPVTTRWPEPAAIQGTVAPTTPTAPTRPLPEDKEAPVPPGAPSPPTSPDFDDEAQLVTVLCATLVNTAALGERLGFAACQRVRQTFFALAQDVAQRFTGTVQFFGADGIILLFGAPVACAHHVRQAVLAAREFQQRLCAPYADAETRHTVRRAVRIAVHTGPMATEHIPDDRRIAPTEMGETIHLAVWLQYLAEPGTLLSSEATMRRLEGLTAWTTPRNVSIPGQPEPVRAYLVGDVPGTQE
jgi:DNA-binding winged helix-turn-helix (wHTH) protein